MKTRRRREIEKSTHLLLPSRNFILHHNLDSDVSSLDCSLPGLAFPERSLSSMCVPVSFEVGHHHGEGQRERATGDTCFPPLFCDTSFSSQSECAVGNLACNMIVLKNGTVLSRGCMYGSCYGVGSCSVLHLSHPSYVQKTILCDTFF